ncbi:MAG: hypothetical protein WC091_01315 [Sulfuricellaceae bacterium]
MPTTHDDHGFTATAPVIGEASRRANAHQDAEFLAMKEAAVAEMAGLREKFPRDHPFAAVVNHLLMHDPRVNDAQIIEKIKREIGFPALRAFTAYAESAPSYYQGIPFPIRAA